MSGTNYILENSQKLPPRVVGPLGASMLTHGWVRTVRTAQNLHNADIQWAECGVEAEEVPGITPHLQGNYQKSLWQCLSKLITLAVQVSSSSSSWLRVESESPGPPGQQMIILLICDRSNRTYFIWGLSPA